jgi:hypothetical protein
MLPHSKPPNHPTPPMCCSSTASSPLFFDHNAHTPTKMSSKTRKTFVFLVYSYNLRFTDAKLLAHFAAYDPVSVFRGSHLVTGNRNIAYVYFTAVSNRIAVQKLSKSFLLARMLHVIPAKHKVSCHLSEPRCGRAGMMDGP